MTNELINRLKLIKVNHLDTESFKQVEDFFKQYNYSLYEYNWLHIALYNSVEKDIFIVNNEYVQSFIFVDSNNNSLTFFAPLILNSGLFKHLVDNIKELSFEVKIQSVTKEWMQSNNEALSYLKFIVSERSLNEVIYSTKKLSLLEGKEFSKLRNTRNKFENRLKLEEFDSKNIKYTLEVLSKWQKYQGVKYSKNKFEKEVKVLQRLSNGNIPENIECNLVSVDDNYLGYYVLIYPTIEGFPGIIYLLKGLNRAELDGLHGITDAIYLQVFKCAYDKGVEHLNDGDLGKEQGTIEHKLRFWPVDRLQYFDLLLL